MAYRNHTVKIDFHTHIYPDKVAHKTVSAVCQRSGIEAYTDGTLEGLKGSMATAGMDRGLPYPVHATPKRLAEVHRIIPELCMIVAHLGGEDAYEETALHLLGKNIYMDTSFVMRKMPGAFLEHFLKEHPVERLLFASDSPWTDQGEELRFLLQLPFLTESDKEKICFFNAARLLGINQ